MRRAYNIMAVLAALLVAAVGGGGATVWICIGADGHVGLKAAPGACDDCCEGHVSRDASRDDHHGEDAAGLRGAPHDCDCVDIAIRVDRLDPVPVKLKARHHQPTVAPALAPPIRVRTVDLRPRRSAPHAHAAIFLLRTVVLLV
ncbi:MAG: hypothetical protein ACYTKD_22380 [Planctomycetota bacterium]|jgi:hypothetical protein